MSEEELQSKLESSQFQNKWMIYLFPFPKFAFVTIIVGIFPFLAGVCLFIVGIFELPTTMYMYAVFLIGLGVAALSIGVFLIKFGIELWIESRPYWTFHSKGKEHKI